MLDYFGFDFRHIPPTVEPNRITGVGRFHIRGRQKNEAYHKQKKKTAARMAKQSRKRNWKC